MIDYFALDIGDEEFASLRELVLRETGITLRPDKRELLKNRLRPILRARNLASYGDYCRHLEADASRQELYELVDSITTTHSEFFREEWQLDCFRELVVPDLAARLEEGSLDTARIWSAGCSTGEEPYSLAMVLKESASPRVRGRVSLVASDINRKALAAAKAGSYPARRLQNLPKDLRDRYFCKLGDRFEVSQVLKTVVDFTWVNLIQRATWPAGGLAVIFCRNVLIYMEEALQRQIVDGLAGSLREGGWLFLGHSETVSGTTVPLSYVRPAIYRRER